MKLIELTNKEEILQTYGIYKHCMFMPTEEKFNTKVDFFLKDNSIKIFACLNNEQVEGVIVISFIDSMKIKIIGIAVDSNARGKGVGTFMFKQILNDYRVISVYAETDNDAVGFYQKNGFVITKFSEIYNNETIIRYRCELNK